MNTRSKYFRDRSNSPAGKKDRAKRKAWKQKNKTKCRKYLQAWRKAQKRVKK